MAFLTNRPQSVRLGNHLSPTLILNTGVPQGCVLSPLLYSLFTHDCVPRHNSNIFIKYVDDTTVVGQISNNDESAYREEIQSLSVWCSMNNRTLNAMKTKESEVEHVSSFKFLGVHISEDLSWHLNTSTLVRKAQQHLYFLRRLKKVHLSPKILTNFYRCIIESILTSSITVWYGRSTDTIGHYKATTGHYKATTGHYRATTGHYKATTGHYRATTGHYKATTGHYKATTGHYKATTGHYRTL
ncbi:hypothetical protein QTP70_010107 [Hemibagrus guttatus]|uniref:Reverse transcriptase domain-containing protein n=1 Tax=Hemibagrus guttatus TaxID=175788 RepID=A0AAE0UW16_9TELE|nr:hypothetical protein QTP70_010107 [Hemibagrus guttatus]